MRARLKGSAHTTSADVALAKAGHMAKLGVARRKDMCLFLWAEPSSRDKGHSCSRFIRGREESRIDLVCRKINSCSQVSTCQFQGDLASRWGV